MQDVLQLLGAVEEEVLFRLCDLVVDGDTAGALIFLEELSEQGQDLGRLVTDLLEHLRHLMLVQHMGEVPDSLPVTDEARERLREQANQLGAPTVVRLIDLLAVAVEDMRQGGDPRLPLELALVKVTRPASDLSRESLAFRLERLEAGATGAAETPSARRSDVAPGAEAPLRRRRDAGRASRRARARAAAGGVAADDPAGRRAALDPDRQTLAEARPAVARRRHAHARVPADRVVPPAARRGSEERDAAARRALRGDRPQARGRVRARRDAGRRDGRDDGPTSEDEIVELMKSTFDARELDE